MGEIKQMPKGAEMLLLLWELRWDSWQIMWGFPGFHRRIRWEDFRSQILAGLWTLPVGGSPSLHIPKDLILLHPGFWRGHVVGPGA